MIESLYLNKVGCILVLLCGGSLAGRAQEVFQLDWKPSGISEFGIGFRPQNVPISKQETAPYKLPAGIEPGWFGQLRIGTPTAKLPVALELVDGKLGKMVIDQNGDGDLTNDAVIQWKCVERILPDGSKKMDYEADAVVQVPMPSGAREGKLKFYKLSQPIKPRQDEDTIFYYPDYGWQGKAKVEGKEYTAVLLDMAATGALEVKSTGISGVGLWLDLDGNGKSGPGEFTLVGRPLKAGEKWWQVSDLTPDGAFRLVVSDPPAEIPKAAFAFPAGKQVPAFTAENTDGKPVKFPDDYKGKVVLLDFWATWCGPCMAEVPNVVATYSKYQDQGMEVLGVSLDKADSLELLQKVTKAKSMTWPQIYSGKGWEAEVAKLYNVRSIPTMLLIDGDTGKVIASDNIRGEKLGEAVAKALEAKKK